MLMVQAAKKLKLTVQELKNLEQQLLELDAASPYYKLDLVKYSIWYVDYLNRFREALAAGQVESFRRTF